MKTLIVGVDVDGVLADHISGVLPYIRKRHGVMLSYGDITNWRTPVRNTDIAQEIRLAQNDGQYVLGMRPHEGAERLMQFLKSHARVLIITARPEETMDWTRDWLRAHRLQFDAIHASAEARKSAHAAHVLIDDYVGNLVDFLQNSSGIGVLVEQPWNQDRRELAPYVRDGRVFIARVLDDIRAMWPEIIARLSVI